MVHTKAMAPVEDMVVLLVKFRVIYVTGYDILTGTSFDCSLVEIRNLKTYIRIPGTGTGFVPVRSIRGFDSRVPGTTRRKYRQYECLAA